MIDENVVSTHSRPKAAVPMATAPIPDVFSFNTQPPEGGCIFVAVNGGDNEVSTLSRPKAAVDGNTVSVGSLMFQHSAARRRLKRKAEACFEYAEFQHSAARRRLNQCICPADKIEVSTLSRPKAAEPQTGTRQPYQLFQHSAARRRLMSSSSKTPDRSSFNTQPPEGGCICPSFLTGIISVSTLSRPKAAGNDTYTYRRQRPAFQHSAARRRLTRKK